MKPDYLLCDTCVIIDFINGRNDILKQLIDSNKTLFVNSIIEMELLQGARNKNELRVIEKHLNAFRLLNMQQDILDLATQYLRDFGLSHGLALPDAIIGATSSHYKIPLFTYNKKDFQFLPNIELLYF